MNERIKLPDQEWLGYDPERGDIHGYTFEQMQEFAELIILECAKVCDSIDVEYEGEDVLATWCADAIKKHFGVEE